jgi:hypothetical protein
MLEDVALPKINVSKTVLLGSGIALIIIGLGYGCTYLEDRSTITERDKYAQQISSMATQIQSDKAVVAGLQAQLVARVAVIAPAKAKAKAQGQKARETVAQIEATAPQDAQEPVREVDAVDQTVIAAETTVADETQAALDTCQEAGAAKDQVITDQGTQINTVKADLAATQADDAKQTERKVWYRRGFFAVAGTIALHLLLHF